MAGLVIENLSKRFPSAHGQPSVIALQDLSLETRDGELLVIVGPSGSGKTTLLRLIAGLDSADHGDIRLHDRRIDRLPPEERNVTMVFQGGALHPHMTVRESLASGLKWRGSQPGTIADKVDSIAGSLGLRPMLDRLPEALSGGERQRVALGRSAVLSPDLFLLDEPLAHVDASLRQQLRHEIRNLNRALGTTLIHITHDQAEAMSLGDRVAVMRHGTIQQIGPPAEIYDAPANTFVAQFFGSRPMNLLEGTLQASDGNLHLQRRDGEIPAQLSLPSNPPWTALHSRDVLLGLRPESFAILPPGEEPLPDSDNAFKDSIRFSEFSGDAQYVTTGTGLVIRTEPTRECCPGAAIHVHVDTSRASLFSPGSGDRIASRG